jgi:asparagine synthase (glutamine-hydrolysing)
VVDEGGRHLDAYWKINAAPLGDDLDLKGAAERFSSVFREAVRCRALDEPVAVPVSGGLDSSSVLSQASVLANEPPVALHVAFPGMACDETRYCDALIEKLGVPLFRFDARETSLEHADDDHPDLISQPTVRFFDPLFERAAKSGVRTILTGIGGDHVMDESRFDCADALREGRLADLAVITGIARHPFALAGYRRLLASGLRPLLPEPLRRAARTVRSHPDINPLTPASGAAAMDTVYSRMRRAHERGERKRAIHRELTSSTLSWPVQQANRVASRHGLRVRQPFLDLRVVELMLSVPARLRLRDGVDKHKPILRAALADLLPDAILRRTDTGEFSDFLRYILVGEQTARLFEASRLADLGVIDDSAMRSVLNGRSQNDINRLTLATGMELWLRRTWS